LLISPSVVFAEQPERTFSEDLEKNCIRQNCTRYAYARLQDWPLLLFIPFFWIKVRPFWR